MNQTIEQILQEVPLVSHIGVIITDASGLTIWANDSICQLSGHSREEFIGRKPGELLQGPETSPKDARGISDLLEQRQPFEYEILNYDKFGKKVWIKLQVTPVFDSNGELTHFIGIQHDITNLKTQNEQLESFNHIVSHNLINQVNNINSLIRFLSLDNAYLKDKRDWGYLERSSEKLFDIVKSLKLLLTRTDRNVPLSVVPINLKELVDDVIGSFTSQIRNHAINVINEVSDRVVFGLNDIYMESIIQNLVSNAIKYRREEVKSYILISEELNKNTLIIKIEDNGLGMNLKEVGDHIFTAFQTFHGNDDAIGFGLFLVKKQVESMKGSITLETQEGKGTTFYLHFPITDQPRSKNQK